jgi:uncharacterized protein
LLFFPDKKVEDNFSGIQGAQRQDVQIRAADGGTLYGWLFEKPNAPYVILVNHGNSDNIGSVRWIASNFLSTGASVLLYDYRGYGRSTGKPSAESICADGLSAYDFLLERGYKPDQIILYGQSLGSAVACHVSENRSSAGLILQSGFSSLRRVAKDRFPWLNWLAKKILPDSLDNARILAKAHPPLLLMHGTDDKVVPEANSKRMLQIASGSKKLVLFQGAGHDLFPQAVEAHRKTVSDFLVSLNKTATIQ